MHTARRVRHQICQASIQDPHSCPRQVWKDVRARTSPPVNSSAPLAEELNIFYARFDRNNKDPVGVGDIALKEYHDISGYLGDNDIFDDMTKY